MLLFFSMKDFQNAHDNELCFSNEWFWWWYITVEVEVLRPHCDIISTSSALALLKNTNGHKMEVVWDHFVVSIENEPKILGLSQ